MHVTWTFTGDGLLAFAGGALALFGVWWSNHQSVRNLQKQLDAEKRAREEERERQKQALAKALHVEIDAWAKYRLRRIKTALELLGRFDPSKHELPRYTWPAKDLCAVYEGSAGKLGALGARAVAAVVSFYVAAQEYEWQWRETCELIERAHVGDQMARESAKSKLGILDDSKTMPELQKCVDKALKALEDEFGISAEKENENAQAH